MVRFGGSGGWEASPIRTFTPPPASEHRSGARSASEGSAPPRAAETRRSEERKRGFRASEGHRNQKERAAQARVPRRKRTKLKTTTSVAHSTSPGPKYDENCNQKI